MRLATSPAYVGSAAGVDASVPLVHPLAIAFRPRPQVLAELAFAPGPVTRRTPADLRPTLAAAAPVAAKGFGVAATLTGSLASHNNHQPLKGCEMR